MAPSVAGEPIGVANGGEVGGVTNGEVAAEAKKIISSLDVRDARQLELPLPPTPPPPLAMSISSLVSSCIV